MVRTMLMVMGLSAGQATVAGAPGLWAGATGRGEAMLARAKGPAPGSAMSSDAPQPEESDDTVVRRVYDLRDLAATLPENESLEEITSTVFQMLIHADVVRLEEGVYVVDAMTSEHQQAAGALETLRSLHAEGYQVRVEVVEGQVGQRIRVGDARPEGDHQTLAVVEQFVRRRSRVTIAATTQSDYIAEWSPVVSDNAVGYDPDIRSLHDGLTGTLLVGAGSETPGQVRVQFTGDLSRGDLVEAVLQAPGAAVVSELPISMARVSSRSMDLRASVLLGRATVIGVLQGFGSESQIAVVVEVSPAE